jgi:hypothetical protein
MQFQLANHQLARSDRKRVYNWVCLDMGLETNNFSMSVDFRVFRIIFHECHYSPHFLFRKSQKVSCALEGNYIFVEKQ